MESFAQFWATAVDYAWGMPLVYLLIGAGLFFFITSLIVSRFRPLATLVHALNIIRGKYDDPNDPGEISHFQALTSALSATIGMGNIGGVAIAIAAGGPGAIFWMWVAGLVGMATKFFTCTLATMFRKKDSNGIEQGGPMYFIEVGLGAKYKTFAKFLAIAFALFGMIGCLSIFQANQMASLLEAHWGVPWWITGVTSMIVVGIVILGGITRVGKATSRIVPAMVIIYFVAAVLVILSNYQQVPALFSSIFSNAFGGGALMGGAAGVAFREIVVTGVKRAAFSNEAGIGTAAMAHGAAKTGEPVREGMVAMIGPFLDTNIVCTLTAVVILSAGAGIGGDGVVMTVNAFRDTLGIFGKVTLAVVISLFALSTMISYSYYSLKCSKYLFGEKFGHYYIYVYIATLFFAARWSTDTAVNIIDTMFAFMAVPNLIGAILLSPFVMKALKDYYRRMEI